jgi:hypothetical protein
MYTANLRKVGGSIMLAVPRYTLDELLAECKPRARRSKEEREWLADKPAGGGSI